jgi:TonB family protein
MVTSTVCSMTSGTNNRFCNHENAATYKNAYCAAWLLAVASILLSATLAQAQQQHPDFDSLASEAAVAIQKVSEGSPETAKVLVVFEERTVGSASELGHELADEFADSLRKKEHGFVVLNRDELERAVANQNLPPATLSNSPAMRCYAPDLGATVLIEGSMAYVADEVIIDISALQIKSRKSIFSKTTTLPMTAAMKGLASRPVPSSALFFTSEKRVWVSPDHLPISDEQVVSMVKKVEKGYTLPSCIICANPSFSDAAVYAKLQGKVVLLVQIRADGFPARISLLRGLPCGLTDKAFEAVKNWTFKPATGPAFTPVAAEVPLEVTFQLY